jgi:hypothetical protein
MSLQMICQRELAIGWKSVAGTLAGIFAGGAGKELNLIPGPRKIICLPSCVVVQIAFSSMLWSLFKGPEHFLKN